MSRRIPLIVVVIALLSYSPASGQIENAGWPTGFIKPPSPPYGVAVVELNEDLRHFYVSVNGMILKYINYDYNNSLSAPNLGILHSIAVDPILDYIYAADTTNNRIVQWNLNTSGVVGIWDNIVSGPYGIAVDSQSRIIVSDTNNHRVLKLDCAGQIIQQYHTYHPSLFFPSGIDVNQYDGSDDIWVVDTGNLRVVRFQSNSSKVLSIIPALQPPSPYFWISPVDLSVTQSEWLFLVDSGSGYILGIESASTDPQLQEYYHSVSATLNYTQPTAVAGSGFSMVVSDTANNFVAIYLYCLDGSGTRVPLAPKVAALV